MLKTVLGKYRDGNIELLEVPEGIAHAKVLVTFLPEPLAEEIGKMLGRARYAGTEVAKDDFQAAESRVHPR